MKILKKIKIDTILTSRTVLEVKKADFKFTFNVSKSNYIPNGSFLYEKTEKWVK